MNLIKETKSVCPECLQTLEASVYEEDGKVYITKTCPEHGEFTDLYWEDYAQYLRAERYGKDGVQMENPRTKEKFDCPYDCGICPNHKSSTMLAIIDVTNRCNLRCPICFAHSGAAGYLYEPTKLQMRKMMENLRYNDPVKTPALQFSGGEPTVRDDLFELSTMAKELGFPFVMVDTNGIKMAESVQYCRDLKNAGLDSVYLQFDALTPEPDINARGFDLLPIKHQAIANLSEAGFTNIVLVPVLIKGVNDDQVGDLIRFAMENKDCVKGLNFQPIAITGRASKKEREKVRITIPKLMKLAEEQTEGYLKQEDWFPVPTLEPLTRFIANNKKEEEVDFCCHPHCGMGTLLFFDDGDISPITHHVKVDNVLDMLNDINQKMKDGKTLRAKINLVSGVVKNLEFKPLTKYLKDVILYNDYHGVNRIYHQRLFIGAMHFMDPYNFDIDRLERCVIHYATPDGRIIPFCSMNNFHRKEIETKHSIQNEIIPQTPIADIEAINAKILGRQNA